MSMARPKGWRAQSLEPHVARIEALVWSVAMQKDLL